VSRRLARLAVTSAAGAALLCAAPAVAGTTLRKTVRIGDNYFTPQTLKVRKGTTVTWKWPSAENAGDVHDVKLKSGPKGVKRFHSQPASSDYRFTRKLTVPGTYRIICTLHEDMTMKIVVRRPS
jgi:plastocyanin